MCLLLLALALAAPALRIQAQALPADASTRATVSGAVYDSLARAPLADVSVFYTRVDSGAAGVYTAITDSACRYQLRDLVPGRYRAEFTPSPLDTMGMEAPRRTVDLAAGEQQIDLATPSAATIDAALCGLHASDTTTLLLGHVRHARTGRPLAGASVVVEWNDLLVRDGGVVQLGRTVSAESGDPGMFVICGLPSDVFAMVRASHGADTSGYMEIALTPGAVQHVSFLVGGATSTVQSRPSALPADSGTVVTTPVWRGDAALSGTVRDAQGGPVPNATVGVWGTYRTVTTNDRGVFLLDSLPGGTQTVEARLIGYEPVRQVVHLVPGGAATLDITLGQRVVVLEGMRIEASFTYARNIREFETRRRMATSGYFLGPAELSRRPPMPLSSLVQGYPGMKVTCSRGECTVLMRGRQGEMGPEECIPSLYVDGRRDMLGDFSFLHLDELAAVEIYPREFGRPPQFMDSNRCGAIAVWTRPMAGRDP